MHFFDLADGKVHAARCTLPLAVPLRSVGKLQGSAMLLGDPLHDCEPKAGAFGARGHIGLDQTLAVLLRQSATIVDHRDLEPIALAAYLGDDVTFVGAVWLRLHPPRRRHAL